MAIAPRALLSRAGAECHGSQRESSFPRGKDGKRVLFFRMGLFGYSGGPMRRTVSPGSTLPGMMICRGT